jgi:tRNA-splicing ligase RtcB
VEATIPVGFSQHPDVSATVDRIDLWEGFGLSEKVRDRFGRARRQMGSLGGGNHFIELCLDSDDQVWIMLHSGSRNIGKELAEVHISVARRLPHNADLPDRDLAVFLAGTPQMRAYRNDLMWAQEYARLNRASIACPLHGRHPQAPAPGGVRAEHLLPSQLRGAGAPPGRGRAGYPQGRNPCRQG